MPCDFEVINCAMPGNFVCRKCKKCGHEIGLPAAISETRWPEIYDSIKNNCKYQENTAQQLTAPVTVSAPSTSAAPPILADEIGPGAQLKKMLSKIGIRATPNCACNARAKYMDFMGPIWCEKNIDTIVGWLQEEAEKRGLPFIELAAKALVRRAIALARREQKNKVLKQNS